MEEHLGHLIRVVRGDVRRFVIAAFFDVRAGLIRSAKIFREGSADIE